MKHKLIYFFLFFFIAATAVLIREVVKYEPNKYKYRIYNNLRQKGWFDKHLALSELKSDSVMVMLAMGQSNAGNSNDAPYTPRNRAKVLCYSEGNLYYAKDPLIGDPGAGGSVWTRLADRLIDSGLYKKVVIVTIARGSTTVADWSEGFCHEVLSKTLSDLDSRQIKLTHVLWHQGEANNGSPKDYYKRHMGVILNTIRRHRQNAPFYVSVATYAPTAATKPFGVDTALQNAQREFIANNKNVLFGANTDTIIHAIDRFDSYHFSEIGVRKYATSWFEALKEHRER